MNRIHTCLPCLFIPSYRQRRLSLPKRIKRALPGMMALLIFVLLTPQLLRAASCVPAPSGVVGWWPGNGNAVDIAGGNNGMLTNGVTYVPGEVGQAFNFNSNSAMVLIGNP